MLILIDWKHTYFTMYYWLWLLVNVTLKINVSICNRIQTINLVYPLGKNFCWLMVNVEIVEVRQESPKHWTLLEGHTVGSWIFPELRSPRWINCPLAADAAVHLKKLLVRRHRNRLIRFRFIRLRDRLIRFWKLVDRILKNWLGSAILGRPENWKRKN